jgi:hypothetical protein
MNDLSLPPEPNDCVTSSAAVSALLARDHFLFLRASRMRELLAGAGPWEGFDSFAASWDDLEVDGYMSDRGRYRRRRHAVFQSDAQGALQLLPQRPHYQAVDYNRLNGGVERWYAPLAGPIAHGSILRTILAFCASIFVNPSRTDLRWTIEVHQFRIEASATTPGLPTPEGVHRDGVDHVLVLMVKRVNIACGTTTIRSIDDLLLDSFTLTDPLDAALLDDRVVYHGVTPVEPLDPALPAYRDVLVVTFRGFNARL